MQSQINRKLLIPGSAIHWLYLTFMEFPQVPLGFQFFLILENEGWGGDGRRGKRQYRFSVRGFLTGPSLLKQREKG